MIVINSNYLNKIYNTILFTQLYAKIVLKYRSIAGLEDKIGDDIRAICCPPGAIKVVINERQRWRQQIMTWLEG